MAGVLKSLLCLLMENHYDRHVGVSELYATNWRGFMGNFL